MLWTTHIGQLTSSFRQLHVRQLELDIFADPLGGLFSRPDGYQLIVEFGGDAGADPNEDGVLSQPGMKILHSPGYDYRTSVPTLISALQEVHQWSQRNPAHAPIMILIELKESVTGPVKAKLVPFDEEQLQAVDAEIRSVFSELEMITPDSVRGHRATLREAILKDGWPSLSNSRGKVFFALDNGDRLRDLYLAEHPSLIGRVMFASVDMDHEAAGFVKLNDPVADFATIQNAVKSGFIVRTRADSETREARTRDTSRREKAFASGAQYISTDFPEPDLRFSDYQVRLEGNQTVRINPVSASQWSGKLLSESIELKENNDVDK